MCGQRRRKKLYSLTPPVLVPLLHLQLWHVDSVSWLWFALFTSPMPRNKLHARSTHRSSPEIIADFIAMATAEDGPDTVSAVHAQPRSLAPCWPNTVPCTHHHQQWLLGRDTTPCHS